MRLFAFEFKSGRFLSFMKGKLLSFDPDKFIAKVEKLSDEEINELLAREAWNDRRERSLAQEVLRRRELALNEASQAEQIEIARSAKDAAWEAASAARVAADEAREQSRIARAAKTRATIAVIIAALGVIISIIMPFVTKPT